MIKKRKLKELELGDIMAALIKQEATVDRTQQYKRLLGRGWTKLQHYQQEDQSFSLPQFATKEMSYAEILQYHIHNQITDTTENEKALKKLDAHLKNSLYSYSGKLKEGEETINNIQTSLSVACSMTNKQRTSLSNTIDGLKKGYARIIPKIHKINNIKKVLQIISVWGQAKLSQILSIDVDHPERYNLQHIFSLLAQAHQIIMDTGSSTMLKNIMKSVDLKRQTIISRVCENFTHGIIRFSNIDQYKKWYMQYIEIREAGLCHNVMTHQGIVKILQMNALTMYDNTLKKINQSAKLDVLNENDYLQFFDELIEEYVIYFKSWHLVTSFHLDNETNYGKLFLENRRLVFITLSEQISSSLRNSNKFVSLEYRVKLGLVQKLQDYMEAGEKWMGQCELISLRQVVTNKLKKELQNIFNLYNNLIKNVLTQELSVIALQNAELSVKVQEPKILYNLEELNYNKISLFLCSTRMPFVENSPLPAYPEIHLQMGQIFIEMIGEYLERAKYLQTDKTIYINKIIQHFEFILFIMYQVCILDTVKASINEDLGKKMSQISQPSLKNLNQPVRIANMKKKYEDLIAFTAAIGNKYNGVRVAGIIDVNKVFASQDPNIINGYTKLVIRVVNDLLSILKWLHQAIPKSVLKGHRQYGEVMKLKNISELIFQIILENNTEMLQNKYIENIWSIMSKLKWEVKKFNQETAVAYKEYKTKALQIFRFHTLLFIVWSEAPQLSEFVQQKQSGALYRSMMQCYGRIDKINDNGRQLIRMDSLEMMKNLNQLGVKCTVWSSWFDKYLDLIVERNYLVIVERVRKVGSLYLPKVWKYHIMYIINDLSFREKKEYYSQITRIYLQFLSQI